MKVGEIIGALASERGINLRQLALKADIPYNTLYAIVKRKSERIEPATLQAIAAALSVDPYSLMSFDQASEAIAARINARDRVNAALDQLNDTGMEKAAAAVEVIAEVPRYQAGKSRQEAGKPAPAPPEGKDTTPAGPPPESAETGE